MSPRGGYRGAHAVRKSRKLPTNKIAVYQQCHQKFNELSRNLGIPVVEVIYRILNHKDFKNMIDNIKQNIDENWHEQKINSEGSFYQ
jgi:hypothetical protein